MASMASNEMIFKTKVVLRVNNFTDVNTHTVSETAHYEEYPFDIGPDEWQVDINNDDLYEEIGVDLKLIKSTNETIDAQFMVYILTADCQRLNTQFIERQPFDQEGLDAFQIVVKTSQLLDQMDTYLLNNCLTIGFDITVFKTINFDYAKRFCFEKHFNNKELSDCRLLVGGKEFFVWKAILMDRSQVFYNMFTNDMSEKTTMEVIIDDIEPQFFEEFLRFLYFGDSEKLDLWSEELLYVSEKYMVSELKTICLNLYYLRINPKNAFQVLEVMNKYGNIELKTKAIEYMKDNVFECLETQWHKHFGNNKELIEQMMKHMKSDPKTKKASETMVYTYLSSV